MSGFEYLILLIIIITLAGIALGSLPKLRMNRATIALVGATALIIIGALNLEDAYKAIDINTIILLFSMMILNINLRLSGFFKIITSKIISLANTPKQLLALIIFSAGLLSALFLNDTIVIMFTPLILDITFSLKRNPIPYLIALATSANVGSVATIVGNPQNMIIGIFSKISFVDFALRLTPIALIGLIIIWLIIIGIYREEFKKEKLITHVEEDYRVFHPLLIKSIIVLLIMFTAFNLGFPVSLSALSGAALLLITRRIKPERVFVEINWSLLVFFIGLFIITHTINQYFISSISSLESYSFTGNFISDFSIVSAILSNIISNVPAVLILSPAVFKIPNPETVWLALAMSSTFAGNLTLIGSVANLIVAESAKKRGVKLEFYEYLKVGLPVTLITLILGILWLSIL